MERKFKNRTLKDEGRGTPRQEKSLASLGLTIVGKFAGIKASLKKVKATAQLKTPAKEPFKDWPLRKAIKL